MLVVSSTSQTMAFSIVLSSFTSSYTQVMQRLLRILMQISNLFLWKINLIMDHEGPVTYEECEKDFK